MTATREEMEAEREFLLRSLDDLEAELVAGNIDPDTYRELHDDYTARASAVIQTLEDGVERSAPEATRSAMRWVTGGAIVVVSVLAAFLLARTAGERQPGQTITGNSPTNTPAATLDPNTYEGHMAAARAALQTTEYPKAFDEYTKAIELDDSQAEPLTYRGWISVLGARAAGDDATRTTLLDRATADFERAIATNPDYADTYFFKGFMLYQVENKPDEAIPALQKFLALTPQDHPQRQAVLDMLAAVKDATSTTTTP
jgi:tetratricopeptide (TPR) repeat protein